MKIAVTTIDGIHVDQHFGKATHFHVYDMTQSNLRFLESREVDSYCENQKDGPIDHDFDKSRFNKVFKVIKDCEKLYTKQIGSTPAEKLKEKGIEVQLCSCEIASLARCGGKCR